MNKITQDMRFKQVVIEYSLKYGVTKAAIRYKTSRQNIYHWRKKYDGTVRSLANCARRLHSHPNQHRPDEIKLIGGNKPYALDLMLHLHILQNLYDLSDAATSAEVIDSRAFSEFCGVDPSNQVPDRDTIGRFWNILAKNGLQEKLFGQVVTLLTERGLILKRGPLWTRH